MRDIVKEMLPYLPGVIAIELVMRLLEYLVIALVLVALCLAVHVDEIVMYITRFLVAVCAATHWF